jgi:hypothetical protein
MNVIHGDWIPDNTQDFIQSGNFYLWVESYDVRNKKIWFIRSSYKISPITSGHGTLLSLLLPTFEGKLLPSLKLQQTVTLQNWQVCAYPLQAPLNFTQSNEFTQPDFANLLWCIE